jgi:hypothetical protein
MESFSLIHISKTVCVLIAILSCINFVQSSSANNAGSQSKDLLPLFGTKPDKFVASAPIIVAAVCKDGIVIVATHISSLTEPLLMDESSDDKDDKQETGDEATGTDEDDSLLSDTATSLNKLPKDIPLSFKGPFRIQSIDGFGSTLVCAGWRTDGEQLGEKFRSLAMMESSQFGEPFHAHEYGHLLVQEAAAWMAKCAVFENTRALSCVGLLATSGRNIDDACCLWLVDATGSYRVRAHAVGLGAKIVNEQLRALDLASLTCSEACRQILEIMVNGSGDIDETKQDLTEKEVTPWSLPHDARVELAFVKPRQQKMSRIRIDSLLTSL